MVPKAETETARYVSVARAVAEALPFAAALIPSSLGAFSHHIIEASDVPLLVANLARAVFLA
jgi:hypothetical protein